MTARVHILLPVHNRRETTAKFIDCLTQQTHQDYHLILIDDGSSDGTAVMVAEKVEQLTVIRGDGTLWWGGALELGYQWLKAHPETHSEVALIINDDTVVEPEFLARGVELLGRQEKSLLLAHCFSLQSGELLDCGTHVDWMRLKFENAAAPQRINCLSTRGLFLRVADFISIGGFYPRLLPHYGSDYEFTVRARRKGFALQVDPALKLRVDEQTSGYQEAFTGSFASSLNRLFSNRALANPVRWSFFILLACPPQWKLLSLLRICWGTALQLTSFIRGPKGNTRC